MELFNIPTEGDLVIPMTNDYLFKALLQENENVLRGLLCSLLHMGNDEIVSTEITNSIILGEAFTDKTFMLDVKVNLNNTKTIELEMQVINYDNWPERSLAYLGREFSKLLKGGHYEDATSVHQIGILNFTLFEDYPSFYSTYMMLELKNHNIYSDKFALSVLDLTQIDKATAEDKSFKIDYWARLFSARTWEDLRMLAQENPIMAEASDTIRKLTESEKIRDACFRREEQLAHEAYINRKLAHLDELTNQLAEKDSQLSEKDSQLSEKDSQLSEKDKRIAELEKQLEELKSQNK